MLDEGRCYLSHVSDKRGCKYRCAKTAGGFEGSWTGKESGYFAGSQADIKVLFDDLIFYNLSAFKKLCLKISPII